jgi:hypothetical protein
MLLTLLGTNLSVGTPYPFEITCSSCLYLRVLSTYRQPTPSAVEKAEKLLQ